MNNTPFLKAVAVIFTIVGLYFIAQSVGDYIESCHQEEWQIETATIINIEQRIETNGVKIRTRKTVYDIYYEYTVDERVYSGTIYGTVDYAKRIGDNFQIKYNPQSPDENTHILSPSVSNLVMGIISSCFFIFISLIMTNTIKLESIGNMIRRRKNKYFHRL